MLDTLTPSGEQPEACGPPLHNDRGDTRRAVLFPVEIDGEPLWTLATAVQRSHRATAYVRLESFPERTLAIRAWSDRVLDNVFCEECREGERPAVCPRNFTPCARRKNAAAG